MADDNKNFEVDSIVVPMEDGTEQEFAIMDEFDLDGKNYMVLSPIEEDDTIGEDEYIYEAVDSGSEEVELNEIEDDEEFERVCAYYESLLEDEMEAESLEGEE
ncbi:MAG: DUF1292 domain-containing protein [Firmicutes bacterium]|nr:DUF1292 domain-containing protein [Bacillota bacterium]